MSKNLGAFLILFFIPLGLCFAQSNYTESLTISTYYPSPYGVYRNLRLYPSDQPEDGAPGVDRGVLYFNQTDEKVYYYKNATAKWQPLGGSGGALPLINSLHTETACTAAHGEIVPADAGLNQCRFNATACPTGWNKYQSWTETKAGTAPAASPATNCGPCGVAACHYAAAPTGHFWANLGVEASQNCGHTIYDNGYPGWCDSACGSSGGGGGQTCSTWNCMSGVNACGGAQPCGAMSYSTVTKIGCY